MNNELQIPVYGYDGKFIEFIPAKTNGEIEPPISGDEPPREAED